MHRAEADAEPVAIVIERLADGAPYPALNLRLPGTHLSVHPKIAAWAVRRRLARYEPTNEVSNAHPQS